MEEINLVQHVEPQPSPLRTAGMSCLLLPQLRNGCRTMEHPGACSGWTWQPGLPSTRTEPLQLVTNLLFSAELAVQPPSCTCPSVPCSHSGNLPDKKSAACTRAPSVYALLSCVYKYPKLHCWLSWLELHTQLLRAQPQKVQVNVQILGEENLSSLDTHRVQVHDRSIPNLYLARTAICSDY